MSSLNSWAALTSTPIKFDFSACTRVAFSSAPLPCGTISIKTWPISQASSYSTIHITQRDSRFEINGVSAFCYPLAFPKSLIKHMALTYDSPKLWFYLQMKFTKTLKSCKVFKAVENLFDQIHLCYTLLLIYSKLLSMHTYGHTMHPPSECKCNWQHGL